MEGQRYLAYFQKSLFLVLKPIAFQVQVLKEAKIDS